MSPQRLIDTARALVAADKGLLVMDESNPTCNQHFAKLGIPEAEEARRWRGFAGRTRVCRSRIVQRGEALPHVLKSI
jgi:fructose-bisphosphate aldolase class 1